MRMLMKGISWQVLFRLPIDTIQISNEYKLTTTFCERPNRRLHVSHASVADGEKYDFC